MPSETKSKPTVEAFANGGKVWLAKPDGTSDWWVCFTSPEEVDEFITALEMAKAQAWPDVEPSHPYPFWSAFEEVTKNASR